MSLLDFGLDEDDDEVEDEDEVDEDVEEEEKQTLGKRAKKPQDSKSRQGKEAPEKVKKRDLKSLSDKEKLAVVMKDAPELVALLDELKGTLGEVDGNIHPLLGTAPEAALILSRPCTNIALLHCQGKCVMGI